MAASINKITLIGNCGRDPEVRTFPDGGMVANLTVATTETWKDKTSGERREATEWHRVVFRGGLAGVVEKYIRKGSQVYIEGSLKSRKYNDAAGVEKVVTEIQAHEMKMLGGRPEAAQAPAAAPVTRQAAAARPAAAPAPASGFDDMADDIPW